MIKNAESFRHRRPCRSRYDLVISSLECSGRMQNEIGKARHPKVLGLFYTLTDFMLTL